MKIKLCGFCEALSFQAAFAEHPDYMGFVFMKTSHRYVTVAKARELMASVSSGPSGGTGKPQWIGVFVNASLPTILQTIEQLGLAGVQLHGEETAEFIERLRTKMSRLIIWKAFRVRSAETFIATQQQYGSLLENKDILNAILVDSFTEDQYGGTGKSLDHMLWAPWQDLCQNIILAGGISEKNLDDCLMGAQRVQRVTAAGTAVPRSLYGIDLSSSLETDRVKDPEKIKNFMQAFRSRMESFSSNKN